MGNGGIYSWWNSPDKWFMACGIHSTGKQVKPRDCLNYLNESAGIGREYEPGFATIKRTSRNDGENNNAKLFHDLHFIHFSER